MRTWLITGGAGFIGSNFVWMAARQELASLVVLDSLTYAGNIANIRDLVETGEITFVRGDICDSETLVELFGRYDFDRVVHFAAESHVDRSILGPDAFIQTNVIGTYKLLEAARSAWADAGDGKLFVHVSTDEVYGSLGPDEPAFTESSRYKPNSPYAASKAAADHLARAWFRTYGLPVVVTNCSNNFGAWQFPEKLIPLIILNAVDGRELPVYGDGQHRRDWLHVEDHCEALLLVIQGGKPGETYAIGGENERPNLEIVRQLCTVVDKFLGQAPGTAAKLIQHVKDRPGHDRRYAINPAKMRSELGWRPRRNFDNSLRDVVQWYLDHREWAEAIRSGEYKEFYDRQYGGR